MKNIHDFYLDDILPPIDDDTPPVEEEYGDDMLFPPERREGPAPFDLEMEMALYIEATYNAALSHMSHSQRNRDHAKKVERGKCNLIYNNSNNHLFVTYIGHASAL